MRHFVACLLTNHSQMVMVLSMKPANANRVQRALADPTRRTIFERLASRQRNESRNLPQPRTTEQKG